MRPPSGAVSIRTAVPASGCETFVAAERAPRISLQRGVPARRWRSAKPPMLSSRPHGFMDSSPLAAHVSVSRPKNSPNTWCHHHRPL